MSMWNTVIGEKQGLPDNLIVSDELKLKIQEAFRNAKPDPKLIEMFRPRPLTFEQLHTYLARSVK